MVIMMTKPYGYDDDDTDDENDHKNDSYTAASAAPGAGAAPGPHGSPGGTFYPVEGPGSKKQEVLPCRRSRCGGIIPQKWFTY